MSERLPERPPVLAGYSHIRLLGRGGFADVFLFEQNMPRRSVAVKVLHHNVIDADVLRMFNAEADVMARLSAHPSILTVYDASVSADGRPYLVMELAPTSMGGRFRKEIISVPEVLNVGVKIASAVETAVRAGVLHRDIKPSNILITTFGSPVLADFGIAASLAGSRAGTQGDDVIAMSVPWSAPEVVEERESGSVASEIWALGATLYSLLAGRSPFEVSGAGQNVREKLIPRISKAKYVPINRPDVPARLEQVLAKAMARNPDQRQKSLFELATDLQNVQRELGIMATPLEVAQNEWTDAAAAGEIDLNDSRARGPRASTVEHESRRSRAADRRAADRTASGLPKPSRFGLVGVLVLIGIVVVLAAATIIASLVIGRG